MRDVREKTRFGCVVPGGRAVAFLLVLALSGLFAAGGAVAAPGTILVRTTRDDGPGSLRDALGRIAPGGTIRIVAVGKIALRSPLVLPQRSISVEGPGARLFSLDGQGRTRVLVVPAAPAGGEAHVRLRAIRLERGLADGEDGGAIWNAGDLELVDCWVDSSSAVRPAGGSKGGNGGGIFNVGRLVMTGCAVTGCAARSEADADGAGNGGGLCNGVLGALHGEAFLSSSTFSGNVSEAAGSFDVKGSRDVHTHRRGLGGGVYNESLSPDESGARDLASSSASLEARHVTIAGNRARWGGGLANRMFLKFEGAEVDRWNGPVRLESSLVGDNVESGGLPGMADVLGTVWADDTVVEAGAFVLGERNRLGLDARIGALRSSGGRPPHHSLLFGSPAVGAGAVPEADESDALGHLRLAGIPSDAGAVQGRVVSIEATEATKATEAMKATEATEATEAMEAMVATNVTSRGAGRLRLPGGGTVDVRLTGPGRLDLHLLEGAGLLVGRVSGASPKTEIEIGPGAAGLALRELRVTGDLGRFSAPGLRLDGSVTAEGKLEALVLGDARSPTTGRTAILLPGSSSTAVSLGDVEGLTLVTPGEISSLSVRSMTSSTGPCLVKAGSIGTLSAAGWIERTRVMAAREIGSVVAGGLSSSDLHAGMHEGLVGLPLSSADFAREGRIGSVLVTGDSRTNGGEAYVDSVVAASTIGTALLREVASGGERAATGISARSVESIEWFSRGVGGAWEPHRVGGNPAAGLLAHQGVFHVVVHRAAGLLGEDPPLPWSYAVLDDTRGGTIADIGVPSGAATWNIGPIVADAYDSGATAVFVPGDLVSGFNDWVFEPKKNGPDAQYGSFYSSTGFSTVPGHEGNLKLFRRPDDASVPWAPYSTGDNFFPGRGNHEGYFQVLYDSRVSWTKWFGQYVANAAPPLSRARWVSRGATVNGAGVDSRGFTYALEWGDSLFVVLDEYDSRHDFDGAVGPLKYLSKGEVPSIFSLDGNSWTGVDGKLLTGNWLSWVLDRCPGASGTVKHCYVFGHSPLYPTGDTLYQLGGEWGHADARDALVKLMDGRVDAYFCGHDHLWDHSVVKGTHPPAGQANMEGLHQILVGTGGADLDTPSFDAPFTDPRFLAGCTYEPIARLVGTRSWDTHDATRLGYVLVTVRPAEQTVTLTWKAFVTDLGGDWHQARGREPAHDSSWTYGPPAGPPTGVAKQSGTSRPAGW